MTFLKIAWRNLLKRPRQSTVLLLVISVGLFGIVINLMLIEGFYTLMISTVVDGGMGHIQVHRDDYLIKRDVKMFFSDVGNVMNKIRETEHVTNVSPRMLAQGLVSSAENSYFSLVYGVDMAKEKNITRVIAEPIKGELFKQDDPDGIYIGKALSEKLKVDLGDKVVIMVRNIDGDMAGGAFRVRGIFRAASSEFEKGNVYVSSPALGKVLGIKDAAHEFALLVDEPKNQETVKQALTQKIGGDAKVETWMDLSPIIRQQLEASRGFTWVMYLIVFVAMSFGIINAFLMEIYDRIREFGIMMSLGTRPAGIFLMLLFEAMILGIIGSVLGVLITVIFTSGLLRNQLDLAAFAKGMEFLGLSTIIPLTVNPNQLFTSAVSTTIAVVVATIYPALRAATFKPVEAIRHI